MTPKTPTHNPTHIPSLDAPGFESNGVKELFLSRSHLIEAFVRVQVECRLNPGMPQDSLNRLRVFLRLVHQPVREAVTEVV